MRKNATAKALIMSILALMLCLSMLVGTTFAWFTDSVKSGVNKIVAGNLDVELEYATEFNEDGSVKTWAPVTADVKLFRDEKSDGTKNLWEPGHTEVVYLKVRNVGTLALKYKLAVNVTNETTGNNAVDGTKFSLSDYLVFGKVEMDAPIVKYKTREEAWTAAGSVTGLDTYTKENTKLLPNTEEYVALIVYMPTTVGNEANYRGAKIPTIELGITLVATQTPYEEDSFNDQYDVNAEYPKPVSTATELKNALKEGGNVVLTDNIQLNINATTITKDTVIDLNGHTLTGAKYKSALNVKNAAVTIKNGTLEATPTTSGSALYAEGDSTVTVENCTIKTNGNKTYAVCTNGAESLNSTIVIRNSTITAPTAAGKKGYALYAPAGNVTFENCNVTGHIFISGGNITLDGGTYTATGFNDQTKIWNKEDTITYVGSQGGGTAFNMGDSILIADRRDGYQLTGLTIRNITFNTAIDGLGTVYAIKYVDMNANGAESRVPYVIENNTFNQQIDGNDPTMFIDLEGNDIP